MATTRATGRRRAATARPRATTTTAARRRRVPTTTAVRAYPDQGGYEPAGLRTPDYAQSVRPAGLRPLPGAPGYAEPAARLRLRPAAPAGRLRATARASTGPTAGATAVTLQLDDGSGRTYQLREGANVVGRGQDAQFRLPDTGVSRRHLEIRWDGQVALLSDLNSTNGTTVNNAPVQEWQLADGDVIRLGHSEIVVRVH